MKHGICITAMAFALTTTVLFAQTPAIRSASILFYAHGIEYTDTSVLDNKGNISNFWWDKVNGKYCLVSELNGETNAWTQVGVSFTPLADGKITMVLKSCFLNPGSSPNFVFWDELTVEGAELKNPGFESLDADGKPVGWEMLEPKNDGKDVLILSNPSFVKAGKRSVRVWYERGISQTINVKANVPVTIKAWIYIEGK